jgi:HPr kinase/phosphorylase
VRGLGILNAREMFGDTAILHSRSLDLIVRLEAVSEERLRRLDRLRGTSRTRSILGVGVPEVRLFVAPGRNMAVLVEAAARNYILVWKGNDPVEAFAVKQQKLIRRRGADNPPPQP